MKFWDRVKNPKCTLCPLHEQTKRVCSATGRGNINSKVLFVGEAPGETEEMRGQPFVGASGRLFESLLQEAEWSHTYAVSNAVWCRPPNNRTPTVKEWSTCSKAHLHKAIYEQAPSLIVCLGQTAMFAVTNDRKASIKRTRRKVKKVWFDTRRQMREIPVVVTYHPAAILRNPVMRPVLLEDLRAYSNLLNGEAPTEAAKAKIYTYGEESLEWQPKLRRALAFDVETSVLNPYQQDAKLLAIGVSQAPREAFAFRPEVLQATKILQRHLRRRDVTKVGHNLKFDLLWMKKWGYAVRGPYFDTMVAFHLLNENYPDKSLEHLALVYTSMGEYAGDIKEKRTKDGFMESLPEDELMRYVCGDADATYRLYIQFKKRLAEERLLPVFNLAMDTLASLTEAEHVGMRIDEDALDFQIVQTGKSIRRCDKKLKGAFPWINWQSTAQVATVLFKEFGLKPRRLTPSGKPSVDEAALRICLRQSSGHEAEIIQALLDRRTHAKLLSGFLTPLREEHLCPDGKVHPTYNLTGTETGRLSCQRPNIQNVPPSLRKLFRSQWIDGLILQADFSQMELRILAHYCQEPAMMKVFKEGGDIHTTTAARIYGKPADAITKEERHLAKTVNFGVIYGMAEGRLSQETGMTYEEAKVFLRTYFETYPNVRRWMHKNAREALVHKKVYTLFGSVRRFPVLDPDTKEGAHALREAGNFPIQGSAGLLTLLCLNDLRAILKGLKSKIVGTVHDSIILDCPNNEAAEVEGLVIEVCEQPNTKPFGFELSVPMAIDVGIGPTWGDLQTIK